VGLNRLGDFNLRLTILVYTDLSRNAYVCSKNAALHLPKDFHLTITKYYLRFGDYWISL